MYTNASSLNGELSATGANMPANALVLRGVVGLLLLAAAGVGFSDGLASLHYIWTDSFSYSHGYLLAMMSLWLIWRDRRNLRRTAGAPSLLAVAALAAITAGYTAADLLDITIGRQVLLPPALLALAGVLGGFAWMRRLAAPVAFLYFAIPVWDVLIVPLQDLTTLVVSAALSTTGITAFIEVHRITTPGGNFEVAEGCSGLHFLIVGTATAVFYGLAWYRRWQPRLLLLAVAAAAALIANWIRVYTLVVVGDATDMQHYLIREDHYTFGWVVFALIFGLVVWFARRLEHSSWESAARQPNPPAPGVGTDGRPMSLLAAGLAGALILTLPAAMMARVEPPPDQAAALVGSPTTLFNASRWAPAPTSSAWNPEFARPAAVFRQGLTSGWGHGTIDIYVARYEQQQPGSKLIYYLNDVSGGWHLIGRGQVDVQTAATPAQIEESLLGLGSERRLLWHWYRVGGWETSSRPWAKALELPALLQGRRDGAVIALSAECGDTCDEARADLRAAVTELGSTLRAVADGSHRTQAPPL